MEEHEAEEEDELLLDNMLISMITKRLSEELKMLETDMDNMEKTKEDTIDIIENKKYLLQKISDPTLAGEEKDQVMSELEKLCVYIKARKHSIKQLNQTIAELDYEIAQIQASHDKAIEELGKKKTQLQELLEYYWDLSKKLFELNELMKATAAMYDEKIEQLMRKKNALLMRTDLTESQMNILLEELENEIDELMHEREAMLASMTIEFEDCIRTESEILAEKRRLELIDEETLRQKALAQQRALDALEKLRRDKTRGLKRRLTSKERLGLLRMGFQITPSGRIITVHGVMTLSEAERLGLFRLSDFDDGEEEEEGGSVRWSESVKSVTSSDEGSSLDTVLCSEDILYLKRTFGKPLTLALAEIVEMQPSDPIHYLGHWLYKYRYNQELAEIRRKQMQALLIERERLEAEAAHAMYIEESRKALMEALMRAELIMFQNELARIAADMAADVQFEEEVEDDGQFLDKICKCNL